MKFSVITFGCKVNQYESQELSDLLASQGHSKAEKGDAPDLIIINSCTVTEEGSRKVRQKLRSVRSKHPDACIALTGCYPQAFSDEVAALKEADILLGNRNNASLPSLVEEWMQNKERLLDIHPHKKTDSYRGGGVTGFEDHTRAFVKIQDGCNRYCTYCIIPKARGFSRSRPLDDIKKELSLLSAKGFKEVVFVGINLSSYGLDTGLSICDAAEAAENTPGIERIRFGSLEPDHITPEVISRLSKLSKFCPQFHISLQSGDDGILKRMNRHYTKSEYTGLCENLKAAFPLLSLTTDIIAGFPGESNDAFENSVNYVSEIGFMKVHAFPYSPRKGTPAYSYPGQLSAAVKAQRVGILQQTADAVRLEYMKSFIGQTLDVLFETPKNGVQLGYTKNYLPVAVASDRELKGKILNVVIDGVENDVCTAHLAD